MSDATGRDPHHATPASTVARSGSPETLADAPPTRRWFGRSSDPGADSFFEAPPSVCPYLVASSLRWRGSRPAREHRCSAVEPVAQLALEKQRRLCLTAGYGQCATYLAARAARADRGPIVDGDLRRPIVRTTPIVLDRVRQLPLGSLDGRSRASQIGLAALMILAFAVVVFARLPADSGSVRPAPTPPVESSLPVAVPTGSPAISPEASSSPSPAPSQSSAPNQSASPTPAATSPAAPTPTPEWHHSYTVKAGDTLTAIAARFDTTVKVIQTLNGITNPRLIYSGQVLKLP